MNPDRLSPRSPALSRSPAAPLYWRIVGLCIALIALASFAGSAHAQSGCTQLSVPAMVLGTYTGAVSTTGTAPGTVTCTSGTSWSIGISNGNGPGASMTSRKLTSGSATLNYQLFQNSALTTNFGNIGGSGAESGKGTGNAQTFYIYPEIAAGQAPTPGAYTDTLIVSITDSNTSTYSFSVTATVLASCTIGAENLGFGTYSGNTLAISAVITVQCTNTTPYDVGLNAGTSSGATVTSREMGGTGTATLAYAIFQDSGHTINWGNTIGTDTEKGTGTGAAQGLYMYGMIAAGQNAAPGSYADTLIATLTY